MTHNLQGGYFRKIFGQGGGYTKNTPYPLFPLPGKVNKAYTQFVFKTAVLMGANHDNETLRAVKEVVDLHFKISNVSFLDIFLAGKINLINDRIFGALDYDERSSRKRLRIEIF